MGGKVGDLLALEENLPAVHGVEARDQVEEGCFAGPVGPDQSHDFTLVDLEAHIVNGGEPPETLGDRLNIQ